MFGVKERQEQSQARADLKEILDKFTRINLGSLELRMVLFGAGEGVEIEEFLARSLDEDLGLIEIEPVEIGMAYSWSDSLTRVEILECKLRDGAGAGKARIFLQVGDMGYSISFTCYNGEVEGVEVDEYESLFCIENYFAGKKTEWEDRGIILDLFKAGADITTGVPPSNNLLSRAMAEVGRSYQTSFIARPLDIYLESIVK